MKASRAIQESFAEGRMYLSPASAAAYESDLGRLAAQVSPDTVWIYFEDKTRTLAIYSLRGAQEVSDLVRDLDNATDAAIAARATVTLNAIGSALALGTDTLRTTLRQVADDPYTKFICTVWR
jgi:hypothetical protein